MRTTISFFVFVSIILSGISGQHQRVLANNEQLDVAAIFQKHCAGCHNEVDREGDFSVDSVASILAGNGNGIVVKPGKTNESSLLKLIQGTQDPQMPPKEEPQLTEQEISAIAKWIDEGARPWSDSKPLSQKLSVRKIDSKFQGPTPITALAIDPVRHQWIVGRKSSVQWLRPDSMDERGGVSDVVGKVNQLRLSKDATRLVVSSGLSGVGGQVTLIDLAQPKTVKQWETSRDILYTASMSPDSKLVACGGYDRFVQIFDTATANPIRTLEGHHGAIYDLDFDPSGEILATASADETIKIWNVATGTRLDTLGQGEGEQYTVRFSPDGKWVAAAGADRRIRVWKIASHTEVAINPLVQSAFAHEGSVLGVVFGQQGNWIASVGEDRAVKLWSVPELRLQGELGTIDDTPSSIAVSTNGSSLLISTLSGKVHKFEVPKLNDTPHAHSTSKMKQGRHSPDPRWELAATQWDEVEPNDVHGQAMPITLPAVVRGTIYSKEKGHDEDCFAFDAVEGQDWVITVNAARDGSPLDSRIEIYDAEAKPLLRTRLQAVRESYLTFRGKSSDGVDDFRVHGWQEMELNQYLYTGGEVVKLWLYPRGPDSGFKVYPGFGNRYTYFDTTATSHALGEPCWIVRELERTEEPLPNGLPVFPIYFENDDDSKRQLGKDSRLTFRAPRDGRYFLRLRDARDQSGEKYTYTLNINASHPSFRVTTGVDNLSMSAGTGKEFELTAERIDGFDGPIEVSFDGLPPGIEATQPLFFQTEQEKVFSHHLLARNSSRCPLGV